MSRNYPSTSNGINGNKARSENEGLDRYNQPWSEIEAGDLRDGKTWHAPAIETHLPPTACFWHFRWRVEYFDRMSCAGYFFSVASLP
jgi:hypothetical protein